MPRVSLLLLLVAGSLIGVKTAEAQQPTLTMGIISPRNPQMLKESYRPLGEYLQRETGYRIELQPVVNYSDGVQRMLGKKWDLAFATNETYLEAKPAGYRALAMVTEQGRDYYRSILIVQKDSAIRSLSDLKGKRIAFVSKKSASGYLYPMKLLLDNGISPGRDLTVSFTGNARIIGSTIANPNRGSISFDVGAVYDGFMRENPNDAQRLRVLAQSDPIPHIPVVAGPLLVADSSLFERFQNALLEAEERAPHVFKQPEIFFDGFRLPREALYQRVTAVRQAVGAYEKKHPIPDGRP